MRVLSKRQWVWYADREKKTRNNRIADEPIGHKKATPLPPSCPLHAVVHKCICMYSCMVAYGIVNGFASTFRRHNSLNLPSWMMSSRDFMPTRCLAPTGRRSTMLQQRQPLLPRCIFIEHKRIITHGSTCSNCYLLGR